MCQSCFPTLSRRGFLAGAGGLVLAGCVGAGETGLGLDIVSPAQVEQMGERSWQQVLADNRPSNNRAHWDAAQRVGSRLLAAAGENPRSWDIRVFQGDEANAFALPGGKIGIFDGIFRFAQDDAMLATILGHEIAHNQAAHAAERLNSQVATELGIQLASGLLGGGNAREIAALLGAGVQYGLIMPYGRNQELEADRLGLMLMARAGYDPRASVALWQRMGSAGPRPPGFLSTHPGPGQRIEALQAMMPEALSVYQRTAA